MEDSSQQLLGPEYEFAQKFAEAWRKPSPENLVALLHPEVTLYQPHLPPIHGKAAAFREFRRLLRWLPALRGEVDQFRGSDGVVFIEWRIIYPIGKEGFTVQAVDRLTLQEGLAIERAVYMDVRRLMLLIIFHPYLWPGYLRYRFG